MGKSVEPNTAASRAEDGAGLEERVIAIEEGPSDQDPCVIPLSLEGPGSTLKIKTDWETQCSGVYQGGGVRREWLWFMFWLPGQDDEDEMEPWVQLSIEEARKLRDHLDAILTESEKSPAKSVVLGPDHKGMRIDASGVLCNNNKGSTQFRKMMLGHLQDLAQRYYAGDTGAVDDFLQVYCLAVDARKQAKERQNSAAAAEGGR